MAVGRQSCTVLVCYPRYLLDQFVLSHTLVRLSAKLMLVLLLLQMDVPLLERWIILCICWGKGCFLLLRYMLWCLQQHVAEEECCTPLTCHRAACISAL